MNTLQSLSTVNTTISYANHVKTIYDEKGQALYQCDDRTNVERFWTYDEDGNVISFRDSKGFECTLTYDKNGNILTSRNSNNMQYEQEYDDNGNVIHYKNNKGEEFFRNFDSCNRCIYYKNPRYNIEYQYKYSNGKRITINLRSQMLK